MKISIEQESFDYGRNYYWVIRNERGFMIGKHSKIEHVSAQVERVLRHHEKTEKSLTND